MRNIEAKAMMIAFEIIMFNKKVLIPYEPLAIKVQKYLDLFLEDYTNQQ